MADDKPKVPRAITSIWPAVAILAFAIGMLIWSISYSEIASRFPSMVAIVLIVLAVLDLWSRTDAPGSAAVAAFWGTGFGRREMTHDPALRPQIAIVLWVLGAFAGMAVFGILVAAPLFCALFVFVNGGKQAKTALTVGLVVFAFQYTVFEWVLDYDLYRGLLFSKGGIAHW